MNAHLLDVIRSAARAPFRRDPAFDDLGDSFWLGGEAQVAPGNFASAPSSPPDDDLDDPDWFVI